MTFSETFLVFLVILVVFLGVKFGFRKSCLCKRNDKYKVCIRLKHGKRQLSEGSLQFVTCSAPAPAPELARSSKSKLSSSQTLRTFLKKGLNNCSQHILQTYVVNSPAFRGPKVAQSHI